MGPSAAEEQQVQRGAHRDCGQSWTTSTMAAVQPERKCCEEVAVPWEAAAAASGRSAGTARSVAATADWLGPGKAT